ncbi:GNAT family N-acetyltransferase [Emticicia sp. TH156]|uniref:GNAT family N-acetyltransferase n=1 Tax=Emticicia sp. TH156 TaxID=2067454 RepID=UPI000C773196|nr:GNAT family N-acetyltransferase [Emticicia sp. TH156]PLK43586.1 GNAT family N-acetyltransferase [Emticicia sp. TH156]
MNLTYRFADTADVALIREIAEKTWFETYVPILGKEQPQYMFDLIYSIEGLTEQLKDGQVFILQLLAGDTGQQIPVAFASYSIKDISLKIYKLNKIYLNPDYQGGGLGKKLLAQVENEVKRIGGVWLDLNVNRFNKARFFYEKMGFEIIAEEDIPIGNYFMNDYVMRKKL